MDILITEIFLLRRSMYLKIHPMKQISLYQVQSVFIVADIGRNKCHQRPAATPPTDWTPVRCVCALVSASFSFDCNEFFFFPALYGRFAAFYRVLPSFVFSFRLVLFHFLFVDIRRFLVLCSVGIDFWCLVMDSCHGTGYDSAPGNKSRNFFSAMNRRREGHSEILYV